MESARPQHEPELEDEGIPDHEGPLPAKVRSGDQQDGIVPPGTSPGAVDRFGTTAAEQLRGDSLSDRLATELPDAPSAGGMPDDAGQLTQEGDAEPDTEKELVAHEYEDVAGEQPEEAAMREVPEGRVPGAYDRPTDGYVEEEGS